VAGDPQVAVVVAEKRAAARAISLPMRLLGSAKNGS
jgi:hypothetical protein